MKNKKGIASKSSKWRTLKLGIVVSVLIGSAVGVGFAVNSLTNKDSSSNDESKQHENINAVITNHLDKITNNLKVALTTDNRATLDKLNDFLSDEVSTETVIEDDISITSISSDYIEDTDIHSIEVIIDMNTALITSAKIKFYSDIDDYHLPDNHLGIINNVVGDDIRDAIPDAETPVEAHWDKELPNVRIYKVSDGVYTTDRREAEGYLEASPGIEAIIPEPIEGEKLTVDNKDVFPHPNSLEYVPRLPSGHIYELAGGTSTEYTQNKTEGVGYVPAVPEKSPTVNGIETSLPVLSSFDPVHITLELSTTKYLKEEHPSVLGEPITSLPGGSHFDFNKITLGDASVEYVSGTYPIVNGVSMIDHGGQIGDGYNEDLVSFGNPVPGTKNMGFSNRGPTLIAYYAGIDTGQTFNSKWSLNKVKRVLGNANNLDKWFVAGIPSQASIYPILYAGEPTGSEYTYEGLHDAAEAAAKMDTNITHEWYNSGNAEVKGVYPITYADIETGASYQFAGEIEAAEIAAKSDSSIPHPWYHAGSAEVPETLPIAVIPPITDGVNITILLTSGLQTYVPTANQEGWDWATWSSSGRPANLYLRKGTTQSDRDYVTDEKEAEGHQIEVIPPAIDHDSLKTVAIASASKQIIIDGIIYVWIEESTISSRTQNNKICI